MHLTPLASLSVGLAVIILVAVLWAVVARSRAIERRRRRWLLDGR